MVQIDRGFSSSLKRSYISVAIALIAVAAIGLSTVGRVGITYDEEGPLRVAFENYKIVTEGRQYPGHLKYYGTLFNGVSEIVFQKTQQIFRTDFPKQDRYEGRGYSIYPFYGRVKIKHVLTFLLSLFAYGSVAGMVGILSGAEFAWLGPIVLALFPRFWGHSFFNPKDIPLAAAMTLGTFVGVCWVGYCHCIAGDADCSFGLNRLTFYAFAYGALLGCVAGIRLDGSAVLLFVAIAHFISSLRQISPANWLRRFWPFYGLMGLTWMAVTILVYPSSWSNPLPWFWETLQFYYREDWPLTVLFEGAYLSAQNLPWHYLPKWFSITIPVLWQGAFWLGLGWIGWRYRALTPIQRACIVAVALQIFVLPAIAIALQSTIYDEARQFLYAVPGIAVIAATTLAWLYRTLASKRAKLFGVALAIALLSPIVADAIALHPYEYLYFNRAFGGLAKAQGQFETDYWAASMRENMEWVNRNVASESAIVSSDPLYASAPFAKSGLRVIDIAEFESAKVRKPFYYVAIPRWDFQQRFPDCETVHQVKRQGVPLSIVKKCSE
ncbi:hypothetical protein [Altericista sp. CCNU0014]|uniref:hypothetical protein n=1 Tax=Altericista sp. CCNU0014 TaxID=3082949 RepID=UPI00384E0711